MARGVSGRKWSVDTTRWPVIIVSQLVPELSDEERMAALQATDHAIETDNGPYAVIHDARAAGAVSAKQRVMIAEFGKKHEARTLARCAAVAFVFDSLVMRAALTAIQWVKPSSVDTKVFADVHDAYVWSRDKLDARLAPRAQSDGQKR